MQRRVSPTFKDADSILNYVTIMPLLMMNFSIVFCLGCSAAFHLLFVKSPEISNILSRLDYGGISVNLFGTAFPVIYYGFACDSDIQKRWIWISVIGFLSTGCFVTTLISKFDSPKFRHVRGLMFMAAGVSTIGIFIHLYCFKDDNKLYMDPTWYSVGGYCFV